MQDPITIRLHCGRNETVDAQALRFPHRSAYGCVDCDSTNHTTGSELCRVGPRVTLDPRVLMDDATNTVQWFPTRVTDILHAKGGDGHTPGNCWACRGVYAAVTRALIEVDTTNETGP